MPIFVSYSHVDKEKIDLIAGAPRPEKNKRLD